MFIFKRKPILEYESGIDFYPNMIVPAKTTVPEWYKKIPKWENNEMFEMGKGFNITIKHCMPFMDSLTTGYMIVLPNDLYVKNDNGKPFITWNLADFPPASRNNVASLELVPFGHHATEFVWHTGVANTIPVGYSAIITHPLNRHDLPFTTLSGIVDGGIILSGAGNIPFYIKKDFEGIIPAGTPILQIIPFLQENWSSKIKKGLFEKGRLTTKKSGSFIYGWYKKTFWTRKKYD
jgi:hypothetical protein